MTTLGITGLVLSYVALATLLLSLHLYSNWNWWIKTLATVLLSAFYYVSYLSIPPLLGWPTAQHTPERLRLIAISIEENVGVYLWGHDLAFGLAHGKPRAYAFPYSKKLHTKAEIAAAKIRRGGTVIGELVHKPSNVTPNDGEDGALVSTKIDFNFIDEPEDLIPEKN